MKYKWVAVILIISFIVQQCAKQTAPTGGPKDETPPTLVRSTPSHEQTKITKDEIELVFDEAVQLNNARDQIIITPSVGKKFETLAKKNKIILNLNSTLEPNTTYSVNFRESIQDITEKNPASVKLAFSTGTYIDSLAVTGSVLDILADKESPNYTVALALATDTLNIFKHPASWITLTNKQGRFSLENLKQGTYILYAFDDKNKNLIVDSKSEKYAFKSEAIKLSENIDSVKLYSYKLDASTMKLISSRPTFSYFNIRLSKSITKYILTEPKDSIPLYSLVDTDHSTIKVYNSIGSFDSLQIRLQASDTIQSRIDTLIYMKFNKKESTKDKFTAKIESCNLYEDKATLSAIISFSKPMTYFNPDSIYIQLDSVTRMTFTKNDLDWNIEQTKLTITKRHEVKQPEPTHKPNPEIKAKALNRGETKPTEILAEETEVRDPEKTALKPAQVYNQLTLTKGSMISVENDTLARLTSPIKIVKPEDTGIILTKVECTEDHILQLLDKNLVVLEEIANKKEHRFTNLIPTTYQLRLIIDKNKNKKWDPGDFFKKTEPEPILFYRNSKGIKDINIKANWEIGPLLINY